MAGGVFGLAHQARLSTMQFRSLYTDRYTLICIKCIQGIPCDNFSEISNLHDPIWFGVALKNVQKHFHKFRNFARPRKRAKVRFFSGLLFTEKNAVIFHGLSLDNENFRLLNCYGSLGANCSK